MHTYDKGESECENEAKFAHLWHVHTARGRDRDWE